MGLVNFDAIKDELGAFKEGEITPEENWTRSIYEFDSKNLEIQLQDNKWRVDSRSQFAWWFLGILIVQNLIVFSLVISAYIVGNLDKLSLILGVLLTGTLAETYLVIRIVIEWIFQDIKYDMHGEKVNHKKKDAVFWS